MHHERNGYVYIMSNSSGTVLYVGVTNDLLRRVEEHKKGMGPSTSFTSRYHVIKLVYYEVGDSIVAAIEREKQLKAGSRKKKIDLIEAMNPKWKDLTDELF